LWEKKWDSGKEEDTTMRTAIVLALVVALQSPLALGQPATEARNETLITLGTEGGPVPHGERSGIATLLQVNGKSYLFDAGNGVTRQLAGAGVKLIEVQKIFLTHLHDDHYSGLAAFVGELWTSKPENPVEIYGPPLVQNVIDGALAFQSVNRMIRLVERKFPHPAEIFVAHEIGPGEVYKDENIKVTAIENHHFHFPKDSPPYGKTMSLSYRIETPNRVIVITGDTGAFDGLAEFARTADLFVTEVIDPDEVLEFLQSVSGSTWSKEIYNARKFHMEEEHMTPESIAKLASAAKVKKIVLTHFPPRTKGQDQTSQDFAMRVKAGFSGDVVAAKDLERF
jgi:ribonuclease BN (tRNA processing enzyme)